MLWGSAVQPDEIARSQTSSRDADKYLVTLSWYPRAARPNRSTQCVVVTTSVK